MIAVVTVLMAFPLGWFLHSEAAAHTAYALAYLWAFTFQTLYLLLYSLGDVSDPAFEAGGFPLSYGVMTLLVLLVGLGLVRAGHALRTRRLRTTTSAT